MALEAGESAKTGYRKLDRQDDAKCDLAWKKDPV